jgi:hypothetical protein
MSTAPPPVTPQRVEEPDWFLQMLVGWVNKFPFDFGITLHVAGFLVSGSLVGGAEYFRGFAEEFSGAMPGDREIAESFRKSITDLGEAYKTDDKEPEEERPLPMFIHLKNARFFTTSGNPIPGNRGIWWRGRVSEVSGFTLGTLGSET